MENRDREEGEVQKQEDKDREEVRREETTHSTEVGVAKSCEKLVSDTEMDIEGGGQEGIISIPIQAQEGTYDKHLLYRLR